MNKQSRTIATTARTAGNARPVLPGSWKSAAGMMRRHKRGMERYIAAVRKEWR